LKRNLLQLLAGATGRHPVLLPREAGSESILDLVAPYRVEGDTLAIRLLEAANGRLVLALRTYEGHFPTHIHWQTDALPYVGPCLVTFCLTTGAVTLAEKEIGRVPLPLPTRRFCVALEHTDAFGGRRSRLTGHYLAVTRDTIDERYFKGDDYVDHEAQSAGEPQQVLDLLRKHNAQGPVLEIGCATGGMIQALLANGFDTYGVDISEWAVTQAVARVGSGRAWVCNVEEEPLPDTLGLRDRFGVLVLWAVLEHFRQPFVVLAKLAPMLRRGGLVVINTTNAGSLGHWLFGRDWEGYFDYSHHGVDQITVDTLADELRATGFDSVEMRTSLFWDTCADPTHASLREMWAMDSRFRRLLTDRHLGDLIYCAAVKVR
jgi:2-polyprenyl-3-methyl-5-hydroxy-6-metoxy-1,4-benzoquinol methylase